MEEISRSNLYRQLRDNGNNNIARIAQLNLMILKEFEWYFLSNDRTNSLPLDAKEEMIKSVSSNLYDVFNAPAYKTDKKIQKKIETLMKEVDSENFRANGEEKHIFNKIINFLSEYNTSNIDLRDLPPYMVKNTTLPQVFLSHAYDDRLYTYALFEYFYKKGVYLYIDWMHHDKIEDGIILKEELHKELEKSSQLLFLRSLNSELGIQGSQIRSWCAWELGEFYAMAGGNEKYLVNLYSTDKYKNVQLHGLKLFANVTNGRLTGTFIAR